ncbi:MAG: heat-inducible transcription repressor HrcA [Acidimicrobiales bacterium]|nr:heat-inducible transcription repressor HrcA [Acidimicrobiales bacterium]
MATLVCTMLDERKTAILQAVVEDYIQTAQPVGSSHIAKAPGVNVSPATVRSEMAALEQAGYLHQPHTSAGRIPTEKGYRSFVDSMIGEGKSPGKLARGQAAAVREFFDQAHGELEAMLSDTSRLLSGLTNYAAVVVAPGVDAAAIRSVQLVDLAPQVVMVVAVLANGVIEKHTIELATEVSAEVVADAGRAVADAFVGQTLGSPVSVESRALGTDELIDAAIGALSGHESNDIVFVDGRDRVAQSFEAVEQVRHVLTVLERQLVVVSLLRDVLDRGLQIAIGNETGVETLADCALVVAPYEIGGETAGTIGVLGPTRMDYSQALAAVAVVSNQLGHRLTEG